MDSLFTLNGKVAIVTGAASGIGQETARLFHSLGARLIVTDIDETGLKTAAAAWEGATPHRHDVASEADWTAVFAAVERDYGQLDILVNNAGIMMAKPFADAGIEILRRQMRINVESVYLGMQGALPPMRAALSKGAATTSIVNIASVYGKVAGAEYAAYSATKGAVRALSKAVASEMALTGVRVNTVMPGPVATNLGARWDPPRDADGHLIPPEEALAAWARMIPMGRLGGTADIAPLVAFLASDAASFITGSEFIADGGYTAV
ncbi:SDR family NAD(P)-dependent oxidoreductase [Sphingobium boeckii]|uniref:NAD(P)-dependent dehydrogenase (Short-subunit alcohol dehydrogenase family) n=1 Tax=Sphingobium boeckii TaxID=1082345 RepID=A0A7W9EEC4_9SPHN|nr:SDR family oxidoreductase [Sphingobium boeckii]MBB5685879.1 NAD(P)-dependent dehydrogenase (short-subunit alcohol dehydrogenase family) [Sphingobium boeckii]